MKHPTRLRRQRGSLLIVAMVFSAVIAVVLTSYIKMSTTALALSQRAFYANQAMNLTESGLEFAMAAINANTFPSATWTAINGGIDATAALTGTTYFPNLPGATASVKLYIQGYTGSSPLVVAKGLVTPADGSAIGNAAIYKMVEISGLVQRSLFAKGLVGRNGLSFSGANATVNSWDSNPTAAAAGAYTPVAYAAGVAHDKGSIAAINVTATDAVGNAKIWGSASVGGSSTSAITIGPQGSVGPFGTAAGVKDASSVSSNFTANLPAVTTPNPTLTPTLAAINSSTTLPRTNGSGVITDTPAVDGKYYYNVPSMTLGGSADTVTISAGTNVVLLFTTAPGNPAIKITGNNSSISVGSGATLDIYTSADISISGQGIVNGNATNASDAVKIWGTNPTDPATNGGTVAQSISITGNGSLACTCYAPNASLSAKGGGNSGSIYGAFVAYSVTVTGNDAFHYDENLARKGNAGFFNPTKWRELVTAPDRATYASYF